jgi:hypothetical protein
MPKSTAQVLAEQQRGADRLRQPPSTAVTIPQAARSTALTVPTRTALDSYLDATAPSAFSGRLVKFSKEGKFVIADSGDAVDDTIDFVALCDEVLVGWLKFNGENTPPDRVQGLLYEGFALPPRETLGDLDQTKWEAGLTGAPEDPWLHQMNLVLQHGATGEIFTFSTTSKTGRRAIVDLLRHYNRLHASDDDLYPVVRLKASGFQHKRVGWVATPLFVIVGKAPRNSAAKPDTSIGADMNDELPWQ